MGQKYNLNNEYSPDFQCHSVLNKIIATSISSPRSESSRCHSSFIHYSALPKRLASSHGADVYAAKCCGASCQQFEGALG